MSDETKKNETEKMDIKFEGFDVELSGLASVATSFALINSKADNLEPEIVDLIKMSRRYLKLAINKAIERHGGEIEDAKIYPM